VASAISTNGTYRPKLAKNDRERAELESRSPEIQQAIVTAFGDTHVDRCTTCHIAADDPRFTNHGEPLKTHPYSAAMGDVERNGRATAAAACAVLRC